MTAFMPVPGAERLHFGEAAVSLRVAKPVEPRLSALTPEAGIVDRLRERLLEAAALDVKGVVVPGNPHRLGHGRDICLGLRDLACLVERQARERLLLVRTEDDPSLVVFGDADPRALRGPIGLGDHLHFEAMLRLDHRVRIGGIVLADIQRQSTAAARARRRRLSWLRAAGTRRRLHESGLSESHQQHTEGGGGPAPSSGLHPVLVISSDRQERSDHPRRRGTP